MDLHLYDTVCHNTTRHDTLGFSFIPLITFKTNSQIKFLPLQVHYAVVFLYLCWKQKSSFSFLKTSTYWKNKTSPLPTYLVYCSSFAPQQDLHRPRIAWQLPCHTINQRLAISIATHPIPNIKKRHKNIKAMNTTASPLPLILVSIAIVSKHSQPKTRENMLCLKP